MVLVLISSILSILAKVARTQARLSSRSHRHVRPLHTPAAYQSSSKLFECPALPEEPPTPGHFGSSLGGGSCSVPMAADIGFVSVDFIFFLRSSTSFVSTPAAFLNSPVAFS